MKITPVIIKCLRVIVSLPHVILSPPPVILRRKPKSEPSPGSEQIEHTKTECLYAKLCEREGNPRQLVSGSYHPSDSTPDWSDSEHTQSSPHPTPLPRRGNRRKFLLSCGRGKQPYAQQRVTDAGEGWQNHNHVNDNNKINCHPESTTRHSERSEESKKRLKQESNKNPLRHLESTSRHSERSEESKTRI